jgi:inosose dehydratase
MHDAKPPRRSFVLGCAAASAAGIASVVAKASAAPAVSKAGAGSRSGGAKGAWIRWSQGWLLWRGVAGQTLRRAILDLAAVGADGIEYTPRGEAKEELGRDQLLAFLGERNMSVAGQYFGAPTSDPARRDEILAAARARIQSARDYRCPNLVIGPPGDPPQAENTPERRREAISRWAPLWNEIGRLAAEEGVTAGLHPHLNTLVENEAETEQALAETDPRLVRFAPDTGHLHLAGARLLPLLRKHVRRISYFHFKDAVRPFARPQFTPNLRELGLGEVDFPSVMRLLGEIGYRGWINVEQDKSALSPRDASAASMAYVKAKLRRIYA